MESKKWIARRTLLVRHAIMKILAPKVYTNATSEHIVVELRPSIRFINKMFGRPLVGAEIGVREAENAYSILKTLPIKILYLVDPYIPYSDGDNFVDKEIQKDYVRNAKRRLKGLGTFRFIFKSSEDAVAEIPNELDFVYIDGNHDYEHVKQDVTLYFPKLRSGGILCGHDYNSYWKDVMQAVDEFVNSKELELHTDNSDWWIIKR